MALSAAHNMRYGKDDQDAFTPVQYAAVSCAAVTICSHKLLVMSLGPTQARTVQIFILVVCFLVCMQGFETQTKSGKGGRDTRVAIAGYGRRGRLLAEAVEQTQGLVLVWVWGTKEDLEGVDEEQLPSSVRLNDLSKFGIKSRCDVIVDMADAPVTAEHGEAFLKFADLVVPSPGCFADKHIRERLCTAAVQARRRIIVPHFTGSAGSAGGALALADDGSASLWSGMMAHIQQLTARGVLEQLHVSLTGAGQPYKGNADEAAKKYPELSAPSSRVGHTLGSVALAAQSALTVRIRAPHGARYGADRS